MYKIIIRLEKGALLLSVFVFIFVLALPLFTKMSLLKALIGAFPNLFLAYLLYRLSRKEG